MNINSVRVCVSASKNFQKYDVEFIVSDLFEGDMETLKTMALNAAVDGVNSLCNMTGNNSNDPPKTETKTTTPSYMNTNQFKVPRNPNYPNPVIPSEGPSVGTVKNFNGVDYKLCFNRQNNQYYYAIVDQNLIAQGYKKYIPYGA